MPEQPVPPPPLAATAPPPSPKARAKALRPFYRKKRFIIPAAILVLVFLFSLVADDDAASPETETSELADEAEPESEPDTEPESDADPVSDGVPERAEVEEVAAVGEPAADGQFTFTVNTLDCGASTVGDEPFAEEAQGQWCELHLTVENTGNEARGLSASGQYLYDVSERRFSASTLFGVDTPIYKQINPGNSVEGSVYFDVPTDFEAASVELHDLLFSGGVLVILD